jgi:hypothetical protein
MRIGLTRFAVVSLLITTSASHAVTVYSYTGGNFNDFPLDGSPPAGSYTTAMNVFGTFTVAAPFAANLSAQNFSPSILLDLSFSDGRQTINLANLDTGTFATFIQISTDSLGGITGFQLGFASIRPTSVGGQTGQIIADPGISTGLLDECLTAAGGTCTSFGIDKANGPGGSLVLQSTDVPQTPLPAALPLFATGLGALGLLGWRRKRKLAT